MQSVLRLAHSVSVKCFSFFSGKLPPPETKAVTVWHEQCRRRHRGANKANKIDNCSFRCTFAGAWGNNWHTKGKLISFCVNSSTTERMFVTAFGYHKCGLALSHVTQQKNPPIKKAKLRVKVYFYPGNDALFGRFWVYVCGLKHRFLNNLFVAKHYFVKIVERNMLSTIKPHCCCWMLLIEEKNRLFTI